MNALQLLCTWNTEQGVLDDTHSIQFFSSFQLDFCLFSPCTQNMAVKSESKLNKDPTYTHCFSCVKYESMNSRHGTKVHIISFYLKLYLLSWHKQNWVNKAKDSSKTFLTHLLSTHLLGCCIAQTDNSHSHLTSVQSLVPPRERAETRVRTWACELCTWTLSLDWTLTPPLGKVATGKWSRNSPQW